MEHHSLLSRKQYTAGYFSQIVPANHTKWEILLRYKQMEVCYHVYVHTYCHNRWVDRVQPIRERQRRYNSIFFIISSNAFWIDTKV